MTLRDTIPASTLKLVLVSYMIIIIINNRFNVCTYRYSSDIATDLPQVTISCSCKRQNYVYHISPYILFRFPSLLQTLSFLECGGRVRKKNCVGCFQGGEGSKKGPQGFKGCH